jgi:hypothetical protein
LRNYYGIYLISRQLFMAKKKDGAVITFLLLVYDCIAYYTIHDKSGIFIGFNNNINNAKNFFLFLLDLILQFIFNVGIMMTIYYFTPFHFIISEFISELLKYYINLIQFDETKSSNKNNFDFIYKTNNIIIFSILFNLFFDF